jgi:2-keto-3-deoxy-6-phosphogluconate aldolase
MACGGSWMVKPDLIADRKFEEIRNLAARAVEMVRDAFRGQESR